MQEKRVSRKLKVRWDERSKSSFYFHLIQYNTVNTIQKNIGLKIQLKNNTKENISRSE